MDMINHRTNPPVMSPSTESHNHGLIPFASSNMKRISGACQPSALAGLSVENPRANRSGSSVLICVTIHIPSSSIREFLYIELISAHRRFLTCENVGADVITFEFGKQFRNQTVTSAAVNVLDAP